MKSPVVKRSIVVGGHKTSVSLEEAFWNCMKEISAERRATLSELVGEIDSSRQQGNLSSAIRLFVLDHFRTRAVGPLRGAGRMSSSQSGHSLAVASPERK
jgi:predicted DNA-binding ribbon-helix-helix protein